MSARDQRGERNPGARITERDVHTIRFMASMGYRQADIVRSFPISQSQVSRILLHEKWRHLP